MEGGGGGGSTLPHGYTPSPLIFLVVFCKKHTSKRTRSNKDNMQHMYIVHLVTSGQYSIVHVCSISVRSTEVRVLIRAKRKGMYLRIFATND